MIFTRKHIVIAVLFAVVGIAIGIGIKHYETLQTFSSSDIRLCLTPDMARMRNALKCQKCRF